MIYKDPETMQPYQKMSFQLIHHNSELKEWTIPARQWLVVSPWLNLDLVWNASCVGSSSSDLDLVWILRPVLSSSSSILDLVWIAKHAGSCSGSKASLGDDEDKGECALMESGRSSIFCFKSSIKF
jgi:hypothetical protein